MFKIQYRKIHDTKWTEWIEWNRIGEFETVDLAKKAVLRSVYGSKIEITINDFVNVEGSTFEVVHPSIYKYWQFQFLNTESPWKIGLNENV